MRCFVALPLPDSARDAIAERSAAIRAAFDAALKIARGSERPRVSWVKPEAYHLTLAFLGETDSAALEIAKASLDSVSDSGAFPISLTALDAFPSRGRARVLIARIEDGGKSEALYRRVNEALKANAARAFLAPLNPEYCAASAGSRGFSPHITLARLSDRGSRTGLLTDALATASDPWDALGQSWTIDRCALYESELRRSGAVYTEVRSVRL